jgi:hypothetical protein
MCAMTDDVRDRILGLLHGGPATVAGLSARLELPGGVVSYHLKMLEQGGQVRVGASRVERGVAVPRYVSTAAAASPPLRIPAPLPGLTWTGTGRFPVPVWTVDPGLAPGPQGSEGASGSAEAEGASGSAEAEGASGSADAVAGDAGGLPGSRGPQRDLPSPEPAEASAPAAERPAGPVAPKQRESSEDWAGPVVPEQVNRSQAGPRLVEIRRIPLDDATFYEFASRLDALAREFAGRATADAPAAELAIALYRPPGDAATGNGS